MRFEPAITSGVEAGSCDVSLDSSAGVELEGSAPRGYSLKAFESAALRNRPSAQSRVEDERASSHSLARASRAAGRLLHVRNKDNPNWFTPLGVARKRKDIERKGLPSFKDWRFITLTLDPKLFDHDPVAGYLEGKNRMRRFLDACREKRLWKKNAKWAWKMEFQKNGWCHWHLLVGRRARFSHRQLKLIEKLWSLGDTNVERVNVESFLYSFKYAFKTAFLDEGNGDEYNPALAPAWFLDYLGSKMVTVKWTDADGVEHSKRERKPVSFARVRFWQTSRGFYEKPQPEAKPAKPSEAPRVPFPARVGADRLSTTVQVVARGCDGKYLGSATVNLSCPRGHFWDLVGWACFHGDAVGLGVNSYCVPADIIQRTLVNQCPLRPLLQRNRLTRRSAASLALTRNPYRTC